MDTVDELVTPGCPNCAVKHISSALSLLALMSSGDNADLGHDAIDGITFEAGVMTAQAYINFVECAEGYQSHFDYAIGLLYLAESESVVDGNARVADAIRSVRVGAMVDRNPSKAAAAAYALVSRVHEWCAHQREAVRELPGFDWERVAAQFGPCPLHEHFQHCISEIRKEYFDTPDIPEKGGEGTMACKKASATKAACKGGKCSGAAKKGGKKGCCK